MNDSRKLLKHAFILDLLCLVLCFALLFLGTKAKLSTPVWMLFVGTLIALVALIASIVLFVKARKLDRAESKRIEQEILENAANEDAHEVFAEEDSLSSALTGTSSQAEEELHPLSQAEEETVSNESEEDYKTDDED